MAKATDIRRNEQREVHVLAAGMPHGLQNPPASGLWLTADHVAQIEAVSPFVRLTHMSPAELAAGKRPTHPPEILFGETNGTYKIWESPAFVRGEDFQELLTPSVQWIHACSHGVEHLLPLVPEGVLLTSGKAYGGVHAPALAEGVMGALLFHSRRLADRLDNQKLHKWVSLDCEVLASKRITILGTGSIGSAIARLAHAFGMEVLGISRTSRPVDFFDRVAGPTELVGNLRETAYLVIACPSTDETRGLIGKEALDALPRGAHLSVVSRADIVEEAALVEALASGQLGGALLDAHYIYPLPPDHPLWSAPNTLVTPHDAHSSPEIGNRNVMIFCKNLARYLAGETLEGLVDRQARY